MGPNVKVLISDKMDSRCVGIIESHTGIQAEVRTDLSPEELRSVIEGYDALIVRSSTKVTGEILRAGKRLQVVGRAGVGVDNVDVETATRSGIIVMNTPGGNSTSTAEHSFAMLIALARNIPQATSSIKSGNWDRGQYLGVELAGKTLGVIGLGKVGREVAGRGAAFKMRVLGYDPFVAEEIALAHGAQLATLDEVMEQADFITLHLPLTSRTRHFISEEQLDRAKDGAFLVNCARGGIVDEHALLRALNSGKLAGAALDVFEEEPPTSPELIAHERLICTPHLAGSTREAQANVALQIAAQVSDVLLGRGIRNAVNLPRVEPENYEKIQPYLDLAECLGRILAQINEGQLECISVEYNGGLASHPSAPLTAAVLKGIMATISDDVVNIVNAPLFARERGIRVDELKSSEHGSYSSLITVVYQTTRARRVIGGTLFGKSEPRVVRLDDYSFEAVPEGHMLFYVNDDIPGIIGRIGSVMGRHQVNIGRMSCGRREVGGKALTILNVDGPVPDEVLEEIVSQRNISWAKRVSL